MLPCAVDTMAAGGQSDEDLAFMTHDDLVAAPVPTANPDEGNMRCATRGIG